MDFYLSDRLQNFPLGNSWHHCNTLFQSKTIVGHYCSRSSRSSSSSSSSSSSMGRVAQAV
jgi:hypothetical protein